MSRFPGFSVLIFFALCILFGLCIFFDDNEKNKVSILHKFRVILREGEEEDFQLFSELAASISHSTSSDVISVRPSYCESMDLLCNFDIHYIIPAHHDRHCLVHPVHGNRGEDDGDLSNVVKYSDWSARNIFDRSDQNIKKNVLLDALRFVNEHCNTFISVDGKCDHFHSMFVIVIITDV